MIRFYKKIADDARELSLPLAILAKLGAIRPDPSGWYDSQLGLELDYYRGKPIVKFKCDPTGYACRNIRGETVRDPLAQAHLALQHFTAWHHAKQAAESAAFMRAGELLKGSLCSTSLDCAPAMLAQSTERRIDMPGHARPWHSALTQAAVIRVLCRMYQMSKDESLLRDAFRVMRPFEVSLANGGQRSHIPGIGIWLEEYPFTAYSFHVLNGFLNALFSLQELARVSCGHPPVTRLYDDCMESLLRGGLEAFDAGYWTRYDLRPRKGITKGALVYHSLHIFQATVVEILTGDSQIAAIAERWRQYSLSTRCRLRAQADVAVYRIVQIPTYVRRLWDYNSPDEAEGGPRQQAQVEDALARVKSR